MRSFSGKNQIFCKKICVCSASRVPFWRFLITGADQNRELKMWCTVSWTCLQTVRYVLVAAPGGGDLGVLNCQRWSLMPVNSTPAQIWACSFAIPTCHWKLSAVADCQVKLWQGQGSLYFYYLCYQSLLCLPCSVKHRHSCSMRRGCTRKLHNLSVFFSRNFGYSITNLGSFPNSTFSV